MELLIILEQHAPKSWEDEPTELGNLAKTNMEVFSAHRGITYEKMEDVFAIFPSLDRYLTLLAPESYFVFGLDRTLATDRPFRGDLRSSSVTQAYPNVRWTTWFTQSLGRAHRKLALIVRRICVGFVSALLKPALLFHQTLICTRFYFLYGVVTLIGLGLGTFLSLHTHNLGAGFGVGSFILSGGNGMIAVLHSKHKKICRCYPESNVEGGDNVEMDSAPQGRNLEDENPSDSHF